MEHSWVFPGSEQKRCRTIVEEQLEVVANACRKLLRLGHEGLWSAAAAWIGYPTTRHRKDNSAHLWAARNRPQIGGRVIKRRRHGGCDPTDCFTAAVKSGVLWYPLW